MAAGHSIGLPATLNAKLEASLKNDEAMLKLIREKRAVLSAKKLFEATKQVPSPSKDYCQLLVTTKGVVWRRWKITIRNISVKVPSPQESIMSYEDFLDDTSFMAELENIFGHDTLQHVRNVLEGCDDRLSCLPVRSLIRIATHLDLQSVLSMSQVNKHLREVCDSDDMWEALYCTHQGEPSLQVRALAFELGWKVVYFMNKLQLQKELSRRRRRGEVEQLNFTSQVED